MSDKQLLKKTPLVISFTPNYFIRGYMAAFSAETFRQGFTLSRCLFAFAKLIR